MLEKSNKIKISDSPVHGRGVFAIEEIEAGEILEECHFLLLQKAMPMQEQLLQDVAFAWITEKSQYVCSAIVLGSGTVYNHSDEPSATWMIDFEKNILPL